MPKLSDRKIIAVKRHHGWVGRAKVALNATSELAGSLSGYQVIVYSANLTTVRFARSVAKKTALDIVVHRKRSLTYDQVLDLFASPKINVGRSLLGGMSAFLLESMAMGAIPVQTTTACCDEWFNLQASK